ncbi:hypothetical protein C8F04DRAFT_1120277, partial [Mycena alexandri]
MTTTFERRSTSPLEPNTVIKAVFTFSRLGAIKSISSMKMMAGELPSLSPAFLFMISGPLMMKKNTASGLDTDGLEQLDLPLWITVSCATMQSSAASGFRHLEFDCSHATTDECQWTRLPYFMSRQVWTLTRSPSLTRLSRAIRFTLNTAPDEDGVARFIPPFSTVVSK